MSGTTRWTDAELARLRLEGLDHLNRLLSGDATQKDAAEIAAWRDQSPAHEAAFHSALKLRRLVRIAEGVEEPQSIETADNVVDFAQARSGRLSRRAFIGGAVAASVAGGVLIVGRSMDMVPSIAELNAKYRTGTGERLVVRLEDGATVALNTRTAINLRSDLPMPAVELISGEAVLTSGQSGSAALVAGKGTSIGKSGQFSARHTPQETCITCLSGEVQVHWSGERRQLLASEEVRYNDDGIGAVTAQVNTAILTAWQSGTLIFQNMPMRQVIDEINRYRPGRIVLTNSALGTRRLSGTYHIDRLDDFFSQAELAVGATITRLPGRVVILS
ncbi:FecR family protein [Hephaestia caeni]|uniref:FecR family protein n=1 Tax=Hephaestia caeni TaxID=645617 RepID=A0A397PB71_9SPHN|nr:FecR domain-containing protein [Hephaestia caeni]RIA46342.1 FecR family protein [Hephaestia caeni]